MKKQLSVLIVLVLVSLSACGKNDSVPAVAQPQTPVENAQSGSAQTVEDMEIVSDAAGEIRTIWEQQASLVRDWFPDASAVGLVYGTGESGSQSEAENVQKYLEEMGYACTPYPFQDAETLSAAVQEAVEHSEVLFMPVDSVLAENTDVIYQICISSGIPVMGGDERFCERCGLAALCASEYEAGAFQYTKKYNPGICGELGLMPPDGYEVIGGAE